ncbi:hypothetical protein JRO89_XS08G0007200 [Xanthoceras sorbifolium]|uniref:DUF4220 domain-containing protein n=1 Tax=Xanthoceras sorbifolium TaxID=99658 RepID=A0ABQ8HN84_9ROSI|nr:hypothetical protein JRO89_XS08G0007200 [Xanthoceras sorbifolium]
MSADWVATVVLGNLTSSQLGDRDQNKNILQAFWALFLLLHLGGPDTITAYALEDNELWLRHSFGLLVQVGLFWRFIRDSAPLLSNRKRWLGFIGQYNLISSRLRNVQPTSIGVLKLPFVGELLDKHWHFNWEDVNINNLQEIVFKFLKQHGNHVNDLEDGMSKLVRELFLAQRGNFTLGKSVIRHKQACDEAISLFKQKRPDDILNESKSCKDLLEKYPHRIEDQSSLGKMLMAVNQSLLMHAISRVDRYSVSNKMGSVVWVGNVSIFCTPFWTERASLDSYSISCDDDSILNIAQIILHF